MVDFLVIGLFQSFKYANVFPLFMEKRVHFGTKMIGMGEHIWFRVSKEVGKSKKYIDEKDGNIYTDVSGVSWLTTLDHNVKMEVDLKEIYEDGKYKKIDGTDIINVNSINDIPKDYPGVMAVPINFIDKIGNEYELVGAMGCGGKYNMMNPVVDGKNIYARILIKKISG